MTPVGGTLYNRHFGFADRFCIGIDGSSPDRVELHHLGNAIWLLERAISRL